MNLEIFYLAQFVAVYRHYIPSNSCEIVKACLDNMICRADFVMYDFVMHDFSVYTSITNRV